MVWCLDTIETKMQETEVDRYLLKLRQINSIIFFYNRDNILTNEKYFELIKEKELNLFKMKQSNEKLLNLQKDAELKKSYSHWIEIEENLIKKDKLRLNTN